MTFNEDEILNMFEGFNFLDPAFNDTRVDELASYLFDKGYIFNYDFGATKLAIMPRNKDYVIKIPFQGDYEGIFTGASSECEWDYCNVEVERYYDICSTPFKDCFAETIFIGYINDYPIYLQEKCTPFNNSYDKTKEKKKKMNSFLRKIDCYYELNSDWCIDLLKYYGPKKFKEFLALIKKLKWDDDLTYDNVGYKNGHPIIIDFSGFREQKGQDQDEILDTILQEF